MKLPRRSKYGVGKAIGGDIYVHKNYVSDVVPENILSSAQELVPEYFEYEIVKYTPKTGKLSFIQSPNFDQSNEPVVMNSFIVTINGDTKVQRAPSDPWVYHHKWLFVKDDYKGFDVEKSKQRSRSWLAQSDIDFRRIGKKSFWLKFLKNKGLNENMESRASRFIREVYELREEQKYTSKRTSIKGNVVGAIKWLYDSGRITPDMVVLDYGAGKYARNSDWLRQKGVKVYAYDPFNFNNKNGWEIGGVGNSIPNQKFDVVFSSYVINVVDPDTEKMILKETESKGKKVYHHIRNKTDIFGDINTRLKNPSTFTYKDFENNFANDDQLARVQKDGAKGLTKEEKMEFALQGFQTAKDSYQRLSDMEKNGYKKVKFSGGGSLYEK